MDNWIKVERGIRYREHPTRKHGVPRRPDRYYVIRLAVDGVMRQEALGWESEGITLEKARVELAKLREAKRTGNGPRSLAERRELAEGKRRAEAEARRAGEAARITVADSGSTTTGPLKATKPTAALSLKKRSGASGSGHASGHALGRTDTVPRRFRRASETQGPQQS